MSVCIHLTQVSLNRVLKLLSQFALLCHKIGTQFLTQVLQLLLLSHQLLLFFLQTSLLTLGALTAEESVSFYFLLEIEHILLEGLVFFLECFCFRVELNHRLLILRLQFVRCLYGEGVV